MAGYQGTNYDELLKRIQNTGQPANPPISAVTNPPAPTANPGSGGTNGFGNFVNSPAGAALISGGVGLAGSMANNKANAADAAAQRKQQLQMLLSQTNDTEQANKLARDQAYLGSTQMNPVKQQQDLMRAGVMKAMATQPAPQASRGNVTSVDLSGPANQFLGDEQLAGAAQRFYTAAGNVSPSAPPADLSKMGFKTDTTDLQNQMNQTIQGSRQADVDLNARRRSDLTGAIAGSEVDTHKANKDDDWLQENEPPPAGYHWHDGELSEDGSGFWHKLAKYGAIAGSVAAAIGTGGAASPLIPLAIGVGSGAAAGWGSGGGTKAALMGAGLGAIPGIGGLGKGATQVGTQVAGRSAADIAKQIITNPATVGGIVGEATKNPGVGSMSSAGMDYFNRRSGR